MSPPPLLPETPAPETPAPRTPITQTPAAQTIHATSVALGGRAVLITGPSGSGKSDLALRLIERGFRLVSDDRTILQRRGARLTAGAPPTIAGKLEVRGLGIVKLEPTGEQPVALLIELTGAVERMPEPGRQRELLGIAIPLVAIDPATASAAAKVVIALDHFGLVAK